MSDSALLCPQCGAAGEPAGERFCSQCGMPLVLAHGEQITPRQERARKVKPQYTEGELVRVAGARNLTEAEFVQGMLLEEGVPSLLRRSAGFDVPDYLAAGPRDILVPASGALAAREVLLEAEIVGGEETHAATHPRPLALLAGIVAVAAAGLLLLLLLGFR